MITTQFLDFYLDAIFRATIVSTSITWYYGLIDQDGFTGVARSDTMASHPGWREFTGVWGSQRKPIGKGFYSGENGAGDDYAGFETTDHGRLYIVDRTVDPDLAVPYVTSRSAKIRGFFVTTSKTVGDNTGILACASDSMYWPSLANTSVVVDAGDLIAPDFLAMYTHEDPHEAGS